MEEKVLTRRTALKIMGSAALATVMATTGASALTSCIEGKKKRVVLYFTGTGNCLYVARQLAGKEGEILSIPQLMRKKQFEIEADEIGLVYPIYGHMPPYMVREFIKKAQLKAEYKFAVLTPMACASATPWRYGMAFPEKRAMYSIILALSSWWTTGCPTST